MKAISTHISDSRGHYQFGLDPNTDFVVHAQHDKKKSSNHTISSFHDRRHIEIKLIIPINK